MILCLYFIPNYEEKYEKLECTFLAIAYLVKIALNCLICA